MKEIRKERKAEKQDKLKVKKVSNLRKRITSKIASNLSVAVNNYDNT